MGVKVRHRIAVGLLMILFALSGAGVTFARTEQTAEGTPTAEVTVEPITAQQYCPDSQESAFLTLINTYRAEHDLAALRLSRALGAAAEQHSRDMANGDYFAHTLSDGTSWSDNIKKHGYDDETALGENIAAGNASAEATFNQWVASTSHRENMLNPDFKAIGIGRASNEDSSYDWYWTTTFGGKQDAQPSC